METGFKTYHPIVNFCYFLAVILFTVFSMHPLFLIITLVASFTYSVVLNGIASLKSNLKFLIPMLIIMAIINPLFVHKGVTILFYLNDNAITLEAIIYGVASGIMMISAIMWFKSINYIMTSDKVIYLFGRIIPSLSLVLSMTFRFVPLFKKKLKNISEGQRNIGRGISQGGVLKRAKQFMREFSILITWSMENSIETSDSMRARGYGLPHRSSFSIYRFDRRDAITLTIIAFLSLIVSMGCYFGMNNIIYYPAIGIEHITIMSVIVYLAYFILLIIPVIIDLLEEYKWKSLSSRI